MMTPTAPTAHRSSIFIVLFLAKHAFSRSRAFNDGTRLETQKNTQEPDPNTYSYIYVYTSWLDFIARWVV